MKGRHLPAITDKTQAGYLFYLVMYKCVRCRVRDALGVVVGTPGLEPGRPIKPTDFKSVVFTNFTMPPNRHQANLFPVLHF